MSLPITNVVTISVESPQHAGLGDYQVNNLALLTNEVPVASVPVAGYFIYRNSSSVLADWGAGSETYAQAVNVFSQVPNPLSGGGQLIVFAMSGGQTLTQAAQALQSLIFFGGAMYGGYNPVNSEVEAFASYMQSQGLISAISSYLVSDLTVPGLFATVRNASQNFAMCFLYTVATAGVGAGSYLAARIAMAAYMGRLMSVDFSGSNTTSTMQMKDLVNVQPDPGITQTVLNSCQSVGVDCFASIGGLPKVFSNGGPNGEFFADNAYNLEWLTVALEMALFNVIATTTTKIPQTEQGVGLLKNAIIGVLQQAVTNGYVAPGAWNSPDTFGNPVTLVRNVAQTGYYVYSQPVANQSETARENRQAPLIQVAIKLAGAVHSANCIVEINP